MSPRTSDVLVEGLYFGEGPRWRDGKLWFSDFFDHAVKTVDLSGEVEVMVELADQPSGLGWLPDGSLVVARSGTTASSAAAAACSPSTPT